MGQLFLGNILGTLVFLCTPHAIASVQFLPLILTPLSVAFGVWLVGNVGRQEGRFWPVATSCYLLWPLFYLGYVNTSAMSVLAIVVFNWKCKQWRKLGQPKMPLWKGVLVLSFCGN